MMVHRYQRYEGVGECQISVKKTRMELKNMTNMIFKDKLDFDHYINSHTNGNEHRNSTFLEKKFSSNLSDVRGTCGVVDIILPCFVHRHNFKIVWIDTSTSWSSLLR